MIKKEIKYTKQGYSYIECTPEECYSWGGACICDDCNEKMTDTIYLVFILGRAYCERCFNEWANERAKRYEEDLKHQEENHIKFYRAYGFEV